MSDPILVPMSRCPGCDSILDGPVEEAPMFIDAEGQLRYSPLCLTCFYELPDIPFGIPAVQYVASEWLGMDAVLKEVRAGHAF